MHKKNYEHLMDVSKRIRVNILAAAEKVKKGRGAHFGPSLSCVEILVALYFQKMRGKLTMHDRDRFIMSKNHGGLALYSVFVEKGLLTEEQLLAYNQDGSDLFGYPKNIQIGVDYEGGSLGMGLSYGVGQALAAKLKKLDYHTFVLLGDGELNEGTVWEAFMSGAHFKLSNLTAIIDRNKFCIDGETEDVMAIEPLKDKILSFGWNVITCDGHDFNELIEAFDNLPSDKPTAVIANTVKGKGVSFMEYRREWHQARINKEQFEIAMNELEGSML